MPESIGALGNITREKITSFQNYIFDWWKENKRDLPWRKTSDPYKIHVSEVMLQQTQVSRVIEKFNAFILQFPTVHSLANATDAAVIIAWKGLGYNRRALLLKKAAQKIVQDYAKIYPQDDAALVLLPGIGKYTSRAIQVFAFNKNTWMIDTNIRKIITYHFFDGQKQKEKVLEAICQKLVPENKSWQWHQALMDYGSIKLPILLKESGMHISVPSQKKFKGSNRFYRGRIIDILRAGKKNKTAFISLLISLYGKNSSWYEKVFIDLSKDGMIVDDNGFISLPS